MFIFLTITPVFYEIIVKTGILNINYKALKTKKPRQYAEVQLLTKYKSK